MYYIRPFILYNLLILLFLYSLVKVSLQSVLITIQTVLVQLSDEDMSYCNHDIS